MEANQEDFASASVGEDDILDEQELVNIPKNVLTVHNVLASGTFVCNTRLNLDKCCAILGNSYYNPSEFPALRIDVRGSHSSVFTISLFESGRIQSTGGCRPIEAKKAMIKIGRRLRQALNYSIHFQNFEIQNILAVYDTGCSIWLPRFVSSFFGHVYYEPDRFPAVRVRIPIQQQQKEENKVQNISSSDNDNEKSVLAKIRKIIMGDINDDTREVTESVGSYIISASAKRPITRAKQDKALKQETVTANIFSTGKITFTGAKSIASLSFALKIIKPVIEQIASDAYTGSLPSWPQQLLNTNPELEARIQRLQEESEMDLAMSKS